jgi:hypothetical protein
MDGYLAGPLVAARLPRHHQTRPPARHPKASTANATQPQSVPLFSWFRDAAAAPAAAAAPGLPLVDVVTVAAVVTVVDGGGGAGWVTVCVTGGGAAATTVFETVTVGAGGAG